MNNHIVLEPAWKIREIARNALKGYWKPMFVSTLIFYLLTNGVGQVLSYVFSYDIISLTKIDFSYSISLLLGELLLRFTEVCRMSRFRINPHNLTRLMPA